MVLFIVLCALGVIGVTAAVAAGRIRGGLSAPTSSLPPVELPAEPRADDVDHLRFAVGLRGYRMDQVDAVLDGLRDRIAAQDREIARLRARPATGDGATGAPGTGDGPDGPADPEGPGTGA